MAVYPAFLTLISFVGAVCAGFVLAQSQRQRATQLAALLAAGAAWWAHCEARWNAAPDAAAALHWMRLSAPGWAFIGGIVPHLMARYLDVLQGDELEAWWRRLPAAAAWGYASGLLLLPVGWLTPWVWGAPVRVPWGWSYVPGPAQLAFFALTTPPLTLAVAAVLATLRARVGVAPRPQRILIRVGIFLPVVLISVTDVALPALRVPFPRLGSTAYALFGLIALGSGLRYGLSFFTPRHFSDEILETLHEGVLMITPNGVVRRANRGMARLCGRRREAIAGVELSSLLDWRPPTDLHVVEEEPGRLLGADGEPVPVSVSAAPLRDHRGNLLGVVVVLRDLREIEELRRRVLTQARLAAVGELAAGLAHEINNPLAFVRANLVQLERDWKLLCDPHALPTEQRRPIAEEGRELIEESLVGVNRAAEIVRGVRHFTHAGQPARELADLNELVEDALAMLRPQMRSSALSLEFAPSPLPPVLCAPQELRQVFLNLLVNAIDAVKGRGHVTVSTRREPDAVSVEVRDDGCGIAPETLERIFDPFFTTKRVGEGTGLGLGIAWHIVESHGGRIEVESAPGAGATFRVRLPLGDAVPDPAPPAP
jgi:two-component system, NtrC family, sensor kinase